MFKCQLITVIMNESVYFIYTNVTIITDKNKKVKINVFACVFIVIYNIIGISNEIRLFYLNYVSYMYSSTHVIYLNGSLYRFKPLTKASVSLKMFPTY